MNLNEYMVKHKINDRTMAEKIGVGRSTITQYRLGARMPRPEIMLRIVEATNKKVSPTDLATGLRRSK
jgi:transcriptional regulator with XRE-family HTH domain